MADAIVSDFEWELPKGNKLSVVRKDPFGLLHFKLERGELPEMLKGSFTSFAAIRTAAGRYMADSAEKNPEVPSQKRKRLEAERAQEEAQSVSA